jgi:glycosyltransferase involved in cell wall biosynthesis
VDLRGAVALDAFFLFRDSPLRRTSLRAAAGSGERHWLYGADELAERGFRVRHSLEPGFVPSPWARRVSRLLTAGVEGAGGYGGDFATVLACRRAANAADVVFSTVDTVGIPLVLAGQAKLVRRPLVYASIGLLDRVNRLRNRMMRRLYLRAIGSVDTVVAYGHAEADELRSWVAPLSAPPRVEFVPFGVDTRYFRPLATDPDVDVLSIGADPQRDYDLLGRVAVGLPTVAFRIVTDAERARTLGDPPANVTLAQDIPFAEIRGLLARARVVALPVRDNLYSGATTTLLQAMAMAKPVVVTRTPAVASGYGLVDGENCRLIPPGDEQSFTAALGELLADPDRATALGAGARETAERQLGWDRYVDAIAGVLRNAATRAT